MLMGLAFGIECLWLASLQIQPWNKNIEHFLVLFLLVVALYLLGWAVLRKLEREGTPNLNNHRWNLGVIITAGLLFRVTAFFAPPSLSDDIYRYLWDGRVQQSGINPYDFTPNDPALEHLRDEKFNSINHRSIKTIYPPLSQFVFRLCAHIRPDLSLLRLFFIGCDVALLFLLVFYLRFKGLPVERAIIYAWNPLVIVEISSSGHVDSLAIFLFITALFAWDTSRDRISGVLSGLGFLAKFPTVLLAPWYVVKKRGWMAIPFILTTIVVGYIAYLPPSITEWPQFAGAVAYARDWYFNASLYALLSTAMPSSGTMIKICLVIVAAVVGLILARRLQDTEILLYAGLMWGLALILSPVVHPWYALGIIPILCFYPRWSGLLFTGLVSLSYVVLQEYSSSGIWRLPMWVPWVEYGFPALTVAVEVWRSSKSGKKT